MSLIPSAPATFTELVDAYAATVTAVLDLGRALLPGEEDLPTDCPGWTVGDQVRHVESVEAMVLGEPVPDVDVSGHAHVRHDFGRVVEQYLQSRRDRPLAEVLDALDTALQRRLTALGDPATTPQDPTVGPLGPTTVADLVALRTFDIWCHEQDIREAVHRPGGQDTPAAAVALARVFGVFGKVVAKDAAIPPGRAVVLESTGPVRARVGCRVEVDPETGRARGIPLAGDESNPDAAVPTTTITMSTQALMRRAAGRRSTDELQWSAVGDQALARQVLDALAVTP